MNNEGKSSQKMKSIEEILGSQKDPFLVILNGENRGRIIPLHGDRYEIGSSDNCNIKLEDDSSIAPVHGVIVHYEGLYCLRDTARKTKINSKPADLLMKRLNYWELKSRDRITFGNISTLFVNPQVDSGYINFVKEAFENELKIKLPANLLEQIKYYITQSSFLRYTLRIVAGLFFALLVGSFIYNYHYYGSPLKVAEAFYTAMYKKDFKKALSFLPPSHRRLKYKHIYIPSYRPPFDPYDPVLAKKVICKEVTKRRSNRGFTYKLDIFLENELVVTQELHLVKSWGRWRVDLGWTIDMDVAYERDKLGKIGVFEKQQ